MLALGELSALHHNWLTNRQAVISQNIAHAATPGYRAKDVSGFVEALSEMSGQGSLKPISHEIARDGLWQIRSSGNSVSVEQELIKAADVNRNAQFNAAISKAFHRMFLMGAKG